MLRQIITGLSPLMATAVPAGSFAALQHLEHVLPAGFRSFASHHAHEHRVGFIGLGRMGHRMANRLMEKGHSLVLFDTNPTALGRALKEADEAHPGKAHTVGSPAELASLHDVDVIFTMLPNANAVKEVYLGPDGLIQAKGGVVQHVIVDCSTSGLTTAREVAREVAKAPLAKTTRHVKGLPHRHPVLVDAPVTGGVTGAEKGSLGFMVGGPDAAVAHVERFLKAMGTTVTHCGDHGDAQAAKLCNMLVTAINMAGVCEAMALGKRLGVEPRVLTTVFNSGAARSWVTESYNPVPGVQTGVPSSKGYKGGLRSDLVLDQLNMALEEAEGHHSPAHMTRLVTDLYKAVSHEGMGDLDFSALYRYVYGSGADDKEWKSGEKLFNTHAP